MAQFNDGGVFFLRVARLEIADFANLLQVAARVGDKPIPSPTSSRPSQIFHKFRLSFHAELSHHEFDEKAKQIQRNSQNPEHDYQNSVRSPKSRGND